MTDKERYQELLSLLSYGLIRYAEKRGLLTRMAEDRGGPEVVDLQGEEAAKHD